jgi:hypothetical protein
MHQKKDDQCTKYSTGWLIGLHDNTGHTRSHDHALLERLFYWYWIEHLFYLAWIVAAFDKLTRKRYTGAKHQ